MSWQKLFGNALVGYTNRAEFEKIKNALERRGPQRLEGRFRAGGITERRALALCPSHLERRKV